MIGFSPRALVAVASAALGDIDAAAGDGSAALHRWGYWSHFDHGSARSIWPFDAALSLEALASLARERGALHETPNVGDIFLQYSPMRGRFVRTGVVAHLLSQSPSANGGGAMYHDVLSIEAGSGEAGELGGVRTCRVKRRLTPALGDRFVRWWDLELDRSAPAIEGALALGVVRLSVAG